MMTTQELSRLRRWGYSPSAVRRYSYPSPAPPVPPPRPDPGVEAWRAHCARVQEQQEALDRRLEARDLERLVEARRSDEIAAQRRRGRIFGALIILLVLVAFVCVANAAGVYFSKALVVAAGGSGPRMMFVVAEAAALRWVTLGVATGLSLGVLVAMWLNRVPQ